MIVLRSRDLVNWRIIGHVVDDVPQIGSDMNWDRMNLFGPAPFATTPASSGSILARPTKAIS